MREDSFHIPMEDIEAFVVERSYDCIDWEDVSHEELNAILDEQSEDKIKTFLGVVRNGSFCKLADCFYRLRPQDAVGA